MKEYREKEQKYLLLIYILLLVLFCTKGVMNIQQYIEMRLGTILAVFGNIAIASILSLLVFVLDSLISSSLKDNLVGFFFIPNAGYTIFSILRKRKNIDDRFTVEDALARYEPIISRLSSDKKANHAFENAQWYKIYCKYQEKGAVIQTQRDYLLCRDLYIETILFMALYLLTTLCLSHWISFSIRFLSILISFAIITNIATHKKMDRFVKTVIALDIALVDKTQKVEKEYDV